MTVRELYNQGLHFLNDHQIEDANFNCDLLLAKSIQHPIEFRHIHPNDLVTFEQEKTFFTFLNRRVNCEPLQYILGNWSFYGRNFLVGKGVLIPRPETEELVQIAIQKISKEKNPMVYDLCAGSGAIGLTIALECPKATVYLFEKYDDAFKYLQMNCNQFHLNNAHLIKEDVLKGCSKNLPKGDFLISNPPYIPTEEIPSLQKEVKNEPKSALDGGLDGLDFYHAIQKNWMSHLNENATLLFECGENQSKRILSIFEKNAIHTLIHYDFNKVDRIIEINV